MRGTGASLGTFPHPWHEEAVADSAEIVDWITAQPWSDGQVAGLGGSYVGTTAELLAAPNHSAVKAILAQYNHPDAYSDVAFPGGIFNQRFILEWGKLDAALDRNETPVLMGMLGRLLGAGGQTGGERPRRTPAERGDCSPPGQR